MSALYKDIETNEVLTIEQLQSEYTELKANNNTECETFKEYLASCLNGTLEKIK